MRLTHKFWEVFPFHTLFKTKFLPFHTPFEKVFLPFHTPFETKFLPIIPLLRQCFCLLYPFWDNVFAFSHPKNLYMGKQYKNSPPPVITRRTRPSSPWSVGCAAEENSEPTIQTHKRELFPRRFFSRAAAAPYSISKAPSSPTSTWRGRSGRRSGSSRGSRSCKSWRQTSRPRKWSDRRSARKINWVLCELSAKFS